jgi:hypothetical protein
MSILTSVNHLGVIPFEVECGLPFFFKEFFFKKSQITQFLLTKVVNYPPLVGVMFHGVHNHVYSHGTSPCCP